MIKFFSSKEGKCPFKDAWALPGGFMEMDETPEEAAIRELNEETGVSTQGKRMSFLLHD